MCKCSETVRVVTVAFKFIRVNVDEAEPLFLFTSRGKHPDSISLIIQASALSRPLEEKRQAEIFMCRKKTGEILKYTGEKKKTTFHISKCLKTLS